MTTPVDHSEVERVFREESARAVASLVRVFGDIDVAEEAVQEAFEVALRRWPEFAAAAAVPEATSESIGRAQRNLVP